MSFFTLTRIVVVFVFAASLRASPPFNQVFLKATHNSYANTPVGTILRQLDSGCRIVELDIYDTQLSTAHDFIIGHNAPGDGVHLGNGNPKTATLFPWLKLINRWSDAHPHHAPIVLYFDLKNPSGFNNGSIALLDDEVARTFGKKWYRAWEYPGLWPSADSLHGRVLTVLTGPWKYRKAYRWDDGQHPAVAMNTHGQAIEVHESADANLWYWTGQYESTGTVTWHRHGKLGLGVNPAIAVDDHGDVVEMHHMPASSQWFYCLGKLQKSGDIRWLPMRSYFPGKSVNTGFRRPLSMPLVPQNRAELPDGRWIFVSTCPDAVAPPDALHYSTPSVNNARLTYEQRSFVECDMGDSLLDHDGLLFYTAPFPSGITWARAARRQGKIVRLWMFNKLTPQVTAGPPPANYPATDYPYAPWYDNYLTSLRFAQ